MDMKTTNDGQSYLESSWEAFMATLRATAIVERMPTPPAHMIEPYRPLYYVMLGTILEELIERQRELSTEAFAARLRAMNAELSQHEITYYKRLADRVVCKVDV
jgi:hypothetical protein